LAFVAAPKSVSTPYQPAQPTETEQEELVVFHKLRESEKLPALRRLSRQKQLRWIQLLRSYDPDFPWFTQGGSGNRDFQQLLALNDRETAEWMIADFKKAQYPNYNILLPLSEWHTPNGIAFMARETLSNEPWEPQQRTGEGGEPISMVAADILLRVMLPAVVDLPRRVREWAFGCEQARIDAQRSLRPGESPEARRQAAQYLTRRKREIAQLWWKANEKAILAGRWEDVRPGEGFDTPQFRALLTQFGRKPRGANPPEPSAPTPPPAMAPVPSVEPIPTPASTNRILWYGTGGIAVLGIAVALAWRRSSHRKHVA
jgi:hypothetical protein